MRLPNGDLSRNLHNRARFAHAGQEIFLEGDRCDRVIWVLEGWLGLSKRLRDGRNQFVDILLPVDVVAGGDAGGMASIGVTALTDTVIASLSAAELAEAWRRDGDVPPLLDRLSAAASARQAERMLWLGKGTAYERVAHTLLELYVRLEAIGGARDGGFDLPLTQTQIGDLTGMSTVHVCRTLQRLVRDGVIAAGQRRIEVGNPRALAESCLIDLDRFRRQIAPPLLH
ncbi:MAG: Crp/Fnr family transcriptional regulator [Azospirillaceae bacterium]